MPQAVHPDPPHPGRRAHRGEQLAELLRVIGESVVVERDELAPMVQLPPLQRTEQIHGPCAYCVGSRNRSDASLFGHRGRWSSQRHASGRRRARRRRPGPGSARCGPCRPASRSSPRTAPRALSGAARGRGAGTLRRARWCRCRRRTISARRGSSARARARVRAYSWRPAA